MSDNHPKHLAYAMGSEIVRFELTPGVYPRHLSVEDDLTVIHVHETVASPHVYLETKYYDEATRTLKDREPRPNHAAVWDTTYSRWTWDHELLMSAVRSDRDQRLVRCDWTQVPDNQLTEQQRIDWRDYRQALRDITDTCDDITSLDDVVWPIAP